MTIKDGVYKICEFLISDSGWKDLPLSGSVVAYNTARPPQYRKVRNTVYLRGAVKGITADSTVIGVLPAGFRPANGYYFVQNTTVTKSGSLSLANFIRYYVKSNGEILMQYTSDAEKSAEDWYNIDTQFPID